MSNQDWPSAPGEGSGSSDDTPADTPPPSAPGSPPPASTPPDSPPPASPPPGTPPAGGTTPPPAPPPAAPAGAGAPQAAPGQGQADLMTRFLARLIDWVALFIVQAIIYAILFAVVIADAAGGGNMFSGMFGGGFSFVGILVSLIPGAYFIGMIGLNDGRTVGKMILNLQVRSADGTPMDAGKALRREWWNLLLIVPFIGGLATAGMAIFIAVTINNNQPWHDQQAGTVEVKTS